MGIAGLESNGLAITGYGFVQLPDLRQFIPEVEVRQRVGRLELDRLRGTRRWPHRVFPVLPVTQPKWEWVWPLSGLSRIASRNSRVASSNFFSIWKAIARLT